MIVCADPKSQSFERYQPVTIITPNHHEAAAAAGVSEDDRDGLIRAGREIVTRLECRGVLITRGEEGMTLFTGDGDVTHIPTVAREVYDVTGAGDTVIATLTLALIAGASMIEAAVLANLAAGLVVGKVGTAVVTRDELISASAVTAVRSE
jgi:D-beta-D-heptose 7-phosphate kinase/D-beta-D-heptose 1-phosphate adenosyltransferase